MINVTEKSITVVRTANPALRYYVTSWVLGENPTKMSHAQIKLNASTLFEEASPANFNTLEVVLAPDCEWPIADETVLANLIAGLGWAGHEIVIYDQAVGGHDKTQRETVMVVENSLGPTYQVVAKS